MLHAFFVLYCALFVYLTATRIVTGKVKRVDFDTAQARLIGLFILAADLALLLYVWQH